MNGLRYIRIRCNLSLNELAENIGVTRQALSSWENERKEIPDKRLEQLEEFFGINKKYFGEIDDEDVEFIQNKAMFRWNENGKQTYRYKTRPEVTSLYSEKIFFIGDRSLSLDEEYSQSLKQMQQTLDKVGEIIKWIDGEGSIESKITCINRGCGIYEMINVLMEHSRQEKAGLKIPLLYEYTNVWKAMLIAYGLIGNENLDSLDLSQYYTGEDGEWIIQLSEMLRERWKNCVEARDRHVERKKKEINDNKGSEMSFTNKTIEEQIEMVENERKNNKVDVHVSDLVKLPKKN